MAHGEHEGGVADENPAENAPADPEAPTSYVGEPEKIDDYIVGAETAAWPPRPAEAELSLSKPPAAPPSRASPRT